MALAEGTIRKNGLPARRPGYPKGTSPPGNGRPRNKHCKYPGCTRPPADRRGTRGPYPKYCTKAHQNATTRGKRLGFQSLSYEDILEQQGGGCAMCGTTDPKSPGQTGEGQGSFHADHDHNCCEKGCANCFRGLLCSRCNRGLGWFKDDADLMLRGATYLMMNQL